MDEISLLRVGVALILVIGLVGLSGWLAKRSGLSGRLTQQNYIRVVGKQSLGPKTSVVVLEVPGAQLIVGVTPQAINLLHTIECETGLVINPSLTSTDKSDFATILGRLTPRKKTSNTEK